MKFVVISFFDARLLKRVAYNIKMSGREITSDIFIGLSATTECVRIIHKHKSFEYDYTDDDENTLLIIELVFILQKIVIMHIHMQFHA